MKITQTNMMRKDGTKIINGYKIALQKSEVENIGMHDGTELVPFFEYGKIILIEAERLLTSKLLYCSDNEHSILECVKYIKIGNNKYDVLTYQFKMPANEALAIFERFPKKPLPYEIITENPKTGMPKLKWQGRTYASK